MRPGACCASIAPVRYLMPRPLTNSGEHLAAAMGWFFSRAHHTAAATLHGSFGNNGTRKRVST